MEERTVGIIGGGQLGLMLAGAAQDLGIKIACLDQSGINSPLGQQCKWTIEGSYSDTAAITELSLISDVVTMEMERINCDALAELELTGFSVHPCSSTLRIMQDKYLQKEHMKKCGVPVARQMCITALTVNEVIEELSLPFVLKKRRLGYDGHGTLLVNSAQDVYDAFDAVDTDHTGTSCPDDYFYAEECVHYLKELAVMVVKTRDGEIFCYPTVHTLQVNNICRAVIAPARILSATNSRAQQIARDAIETFEGAVGVFAVELFLKADGEVIFNEMAPRVHNSGHYTQQACDISQFEMHMRAITGMHVRQAKLLIPHTVMLNVLGKGPDVSESHSIVQRALDIEGARVYWYGKGESRAGRKLGHINISAQTVEELRHLLELLLESESDKQEILNNLFDIEGARVAIVMDSESDLACMTEAADLLATFGVSTSMTFVSAHRTPTRLYQFASNAAESGIQVIIAGAGGGAAALPGMIASLTTLPVISVPIKTSALNSQDMVHLPQGVPVATVAIDGAMNAALLAVRILGTQDPILSDKMAQFMDRAERKVLDEVKKIEALGPSAYLSHAITGKQEQGGV